MGRSSGTARRGVLAALCFCLLLTACDALVTIEEQPIEVTEVEAFAQSLVFDSDGERIATLRFSNREPVSYAELPAHLIDAVVAAEDRRFFSHSGVDPRAIVRAYVANRRAGEIVQGGSTITQQLIKNRYFPEAENTLERKSMEARLAWQLEEESTKEQILTDYLNTVYLGAGAYGIEAAAQTYFGVTTAELTVPQSALLAGLIRSPERTSPYDEPDRAIGERARVLRAMAEIGAISAELRDRLAASPLEVAAPPEPEPTTHPFFVELVKRTLTADERFGFDEPSRWRRLFGGGLRVQTTIDPRLQGLAEDAATAFWDGPDDPEVAIAVVEPGTGHILATVGGRDFAASQFDLATQGRRQPGSTFKVFGLAAALSRGWRLDSTIESSSAVFDLGGEEWSVRSGTTGLITLRDALVRSSNGAFARLALDMGPGTVENMAYALGVTSSVGSNPSIVLGGLESGVSPLDMATAFATLANGGVHVPATPILRITDADGELVFEPRQRTRVAVDPETAWLTTSAMIQAVDEGTGRAAALSDRVVAGKTGTVQDNTDAWFVGFTPELAVAVWVGYPDEQRPLIDIHGVPRVQGGTWPARIFRTFMESALAGTPARSFPYPEQLTETVFIDPLTGGIATPWCPTTEELRGLPGELPSFTCPLHTGPPPETVTATVPVPIAPLPVIPVVPVTPAPVVTPIPVQTLDPVPTPTPTPSPTPTPTPTPTVEPPGNAPQLSPR